MGLGRRSLLASRLGKTWRDLQKVEKGLKYRLPRSNFPNFPGKQFLAKDYLEAPQDRDKMETQSEKTWV